VALRGLRDPFDPALCKWLHYREFAARRQDEKGTNLAERELKQNVTIPLILPGSSLFGGLAPRAGDGGQNQFSTAGYAYFVVFTLGRP